MTVGVVSAHIGSVGIGVRRVSAETSVYLRMARKIHEDAGEATVSKSIEIVYRSAVSSTVVRFVNTCRPAKPKISNRASTRSASAA